MYRTSRRLHRPNSESHKIYSFFSEVRYVSNIVIFLKDFKIQRVVSEPLIRIILIANRSERIRYRQSQSPRGL